jgi:hypothetical protein
MVLLRLLIKIPVSNAGQKLHKATEKKKTNRLWVIGQDKTLDHADLYGDIVITPYEALAGTQKLINVPWGIRKRIFQVKIPSGIREGTTLRLKGLGKLNDEGNRGDLFLKVKLKF